MLFNEPKLLKYAGTAVLRGDWSGFSALQRAEIAEMNVSDADYPHSDRVSVLFNEPKLLKFLDYSVVANELSSFSALQRAEIAEINGDRVNVVDIRRFSALQRAEIAESSRA